MAENGHEGGDWDNGLRPDVISQDDLEKSLHEEGRSELDIYPPVHIQHYGQMFGGELADEARDAMSKLGVDVDLADKIAARLATTVGLKHFINAMDFGYAQRVLEERAGLPELTSSQRM